MSSKYEITKLHEPDNEDQTFRFFADFWPHGREIHRKGSVFGLRPLLHVFVGFNGVMQTDAELQAMGTGKEVRYINVVDKGECTNKLDSS